MNSPDKWIILKIKGEKETFYRVLAGWSGGYLEGQSWKLNSGITKVSKDGDFYLFEGHSGSVYKCHKNAYGTNMISSEILNEILSNPKHKDIIEELPDQDFTNLLP